MTINIGDGDSIVSSNDEIFINGEKVKCPKGMTAGNVCSQTVINGKIYVNGYEYNKKTKTFKRSLKALWYFLF